MLEIGINIINKNYGENEILKDFSLDIMSKEVISIVGKNGCGKSTLLKLISKEENPTSGSISIRKDASIGYLSQIPSFDDRVVIDILKSSFSELDELERKLKKLESKMNSTTGEEQTKYIIKYLEVQEKLSNDNSDELLGKIIKKFKIEDKLNIKYNDLSGGEKTIVSLANLLLKEPNILLLDEPTNHLDLSTIEWLESYLKNYNGTVVIVSHDRYFLDMISTKTVLIENGKAIIFNGNYSYYLVENEKRIENLTNMYNVQQKEIKTRMEAAKRLREWGRLGDNEKFHKRAENIEKQLEKMDRIEKPNEDKSINLSFDMNDRSGKDVLTVDKLNISFDKPIFKDASMSIRFKEKVCLIGPNGSGKTSLIKEILNNNPSIKIGSNVKIGYIPQKISFPNEDIKILDYCKRFFIGDESHLRSSLVHFNFYKEDVNKSIKVLSGGEKVRLLLFTLMQEDVNFIILDEPTNHIDIPTKETLEDALNSFDGTVLFISHDRFFINNVATRVIAIEDNKLVSYLGNYDDYKNNINAK